MKIPMFQVDAFTSQLFGGNPAAVCLLEEALPDDVMQAIAAENNLAETAFVLQKEEQWQIRWFTPLSEVALCGHATLAAAFVLFQEQITTGSKIRFQSLHSGQLKVERQGERLTLDFPQDELRECELTPALLASIGGSPQSAWRGKTDYILRYQSQAEIESLTPDFAALKKIEARGVIVTAPGKDCDFVSRFFAPQVGIDEDPVTGSAHTSLSPLWATTLGRESLSARQLSARGGELHCQIKDDRVLISGTAVLYLRGEILLP